MNRKTLLFAALTLVAACSQDLVIETNDQVNKETILPSKLSKTQSMDRFAAILSKAVHENKDLRVFLKNEALKQFDKDYDVLFNRSKNEKVGTSTFREVLVSYSSEKEIAAIEQNVPLLNILLPKIPFVDISAENYDANNAETPVAVVQNDSVALLQNGTLLEKIAFDRVPECHLFVVNENDRVVATRHATRGTTTLAFKDPIFDNSQRNTRTATLSGSQISQRAINAYSFFNQHDGSNRQIALQRDYIYYGLTPTNSQGQLNRSVYEYINHIEVDPKAYFKMADEKENPETAPNGHDPYVKKEHLRKEKGGYSWPDLLRNFWTSGAYEIRLEIYSSGNKSPEIRYIPVRPEEIWDFHIKHEYKHKTWFRHSVHYYSIYPDKFTVKPYYLAPGACPIGNWDLSNESLTKKIIFSEEDNSGKEIIAEVGFEDVRATTKKVSGDVKFGLGIFNIGIGTDITSTNTTKKISKLTVSRKEKSDDLGNVEIKFYDPIIERRTSQGYDVKTYSTGFIKFSLNCN